MFAPSFSELSQVSNHLPILPPMLCRSINQNKLNIYYSLLDRDYPNLEAGSTILFEWTLLDPLQSYDEYMLGYIRYNTDGSRDFIYENKIGYIYELKSQFTISYI